MDVAIAQKFIGVTESKYESCDRLKLAGATRPQEFYYSLVIIKSD
ncbi:MAG: hypothetical protein V7K21_21525 [Nostoc sp.]